MITIQKEGQTLTLAPEHIEAKLQELIAQKSEEAKKLPGPLRSLIKVAVEGIFTYLGHKVPKEADKLEYAAAFLVHIVVGALDGKTLHVDQMEVVTDGKAD